MLSVSVGISDAFVDVISAESVDSDVAPDVIEELESEAVTEGIELDVVLELSVLVADTEEVVIVLELEVSAVSSDASPGAKAAASEGLLTASI